VLRPNSSHLNLGNKYLSNGKRRDGWWWWWCSKDDWWWYSVEGIWGRRMQGIVQCLKVVQRHPHHPFHIHIVVVLVIIIIIIIIVIMMRRNDNSQIRVPEADIQSMDCVVGVEGEGWRKWRLASRNVIHRLLPKTWDAKPHSASN
jgi:hypothetical protein